MARTITLTPAQVECDRLFAEAGFTKAGGMWGDAQWKQLAPDLIVSVCQPSDWELTAFPDCYSWEASARPYEDKRPTLILVYEGEPEHTLFPGGRWTPEIGEAPNPTDGGAERLVVASVRQAIWLVGLIAKARA
jgi:hypothetical protein